MSQSKRDALADLCETIGVAYDPRTGLADWREYDRNQGATPMPCGFVRDGVKLAARLVHYRACPDAACKARASAFDRLRKDFAKGAAIARVKGESK